LRWFHAHYVYTWIILIFQCRCKRKPSIDSWGEKNSLARIRTRYLQITASEILPLRQPATDELLMKKIVKKWLPMRWTDLSCLESKKCSQIKDCLVYNKAIPIIRLFLTVFNRSIGKNHTMDIRLIKVIYP